MNKPCLRAEVPGRRSAGRDVRHGGPRPAMPARNGFTLLEMLVALAVFSLAALALIRLQAVSVRTTADLGDRQIARIVAHNLMVDLQTSPDMPPSGEQAGTVENAGQAWRWSRQVSKTDEEDVVRIDIRVESGRAGTSPAVLTFLKARP